MSVAYGEEKGDAAQKRNNELRPLLFVDAFESQIVAVIKENTLLTHPTINDMVYQSTGSVAGCSRHPDRLPKAPKQS